jgi:hypothetical protein
MMLKKVVFVRVLGYCRVIALDRLQLSQYGSFMKDLVQSEFVKMNLISTTH